MAENNEKDVHALYMDSIQRHTDAAQASGDIPETFVYEHEGKSWLLTLPHSVMAQKRLLHAQNDYFARGTYEAEEAFLSLIVQNAKVDGRSVTLNQLSVGELEVLKIAYMDGLLLPLSLGGENAVLKFKAAAAKNM